MAKRNRCTTEATIKNRIKQGRGSGRLATYKPWLLVQDVPSRGLACRAKGWKTGRVHHFLSRLELWYFYLLEWSLSVTDIREQFPLLPLEETLTIARDCGIAHPVHPKTKHPIVLTTDFLITVGDVDDPRTVKYKEDLTPRNLEKLELERRYWDARNKKLKIVTEDNVPMVLSKNVEWLHPYKSVRDFISMEELQFSLVASHVLRTLQQTNGPLRDLTLELDNRLGLQPGTSLGLSRYLLANRHLHVDMMRPINPHEPLALIVNG
jgi:hypothetical protein